MSHQIKVETQFKNKASLIAALDELGYAYAEDGTLVTYTGVAIEKIDLLVAVGGQNNRVGFKLNAEGSYDLVGDFYNLNASEAAFTKAVGRTYTTKEVLQRLRTKRYSVVSNEVTNTGSVKVRARMMVA